LTYKLALFRTNSYYFTIIKLNGQYFLSYFFILFFYTNLTSIILIKRLDLWLKSSNNIHIIR